MSSTRDFIAATLSDGALPILRRPVEDVIYETLDRRQIPNRTDFKELRDLVHSLRGQVSGVTGGMRRLADRNEEIVDQLDALEEGIDVAAARMSGLEARLAAVEAAVAALSSADPVELVEGDDGDVADGVEEGSSDDAT